MSYSDFGTTLEETSSEVRFLGAIMSPHDWRIRHSGLVPARIGLGLVEGELAVRADVHFRVLSSRARALHSGA